MPVLAGVAAALAHVERARRQAQQRPGLGGGRAGLYAARTFDEAVEAYKLSLRLNGEVRPGAPITARPWSAPRGDRHRRRARRLRQGARRTAGDAVGPILLGLAAEQDGDLRRPSPPYRACSPTRRRGRSGRRPCKRTAALTAGGALPPPDGAAPPGRRAAGRDDPRHGRTAGDAARQRGGNANEWRRLIRAYTVLHETDKAKAALASARKALAGDAQAGGGSTRSRARSGSEAER